jgi:hypothetical protein
MRLAAASYMHMSGPASIFQVLAVDSPAAISIRNLT